MLYMPETKSAHRSGIRIYRKGDFSEVTTTHKSRIKIICKVFKEITNLDGFRI